MFYIPCWYVFNYKKLKYLNYMLGRIHLYSIFYSITSIMQFVFRKRKTRPKIFTCYFVSWCIYEQIYIYIYIAYIFTYIILTKIEIYIYMYIIYMQTIRTSAIRELGKALYIVYWFTASLTLHPLWIIKPYD